MGEFCNCRNCGKPVSIDTSYSIVGNFETFYSYHCPYCDTYGAAQTSEIYVSDALSDTRDPNVIRIEKLEEEVSNLKNKLNDSNKKLYEYRCLFDLISSQDPNAEYTGQDLTEYYNSIENKDGAKNENQKN